MFNISIGYRTLNLLVILLWVNKCFFFAAAAGNDILPQRQQSYIDIVKLENEFVLTSAEYLLSLANIRWTFTGKDLLKKKFTGKDLWFFVKWMFAGKP